MNAVAYRGGYKYQTHRSYEQYIGLFWNPNSREILTEYIQVVAGRLWIKEGYAWDGPSGPAIDTLNFMRGSLVHDALYQLMREKHLDHDIYREPADRLLQQMCITDGMSSIRAWWVYWGVRLGGGPSAEPKNDRPVIWAPSQPALSVSEMLSNS